MVLRSRVSAQNFEHVVRNRRIIGWRVKRALSSVQIDRLDKIIKILSRRERDVPDIANVKLTVGTTVLKRFPGRSNWNYIADSGNSDYVYIGFGNTDTTTSGGDQGIPLAPGDSITSKISTYSGRVTLVSSSADQVVWETPELGLEVTTGSVSKTYGDIDGQAGQSLFTTFNRPTLYNEIDDDYDRQRGVAGVSQTSGDNAANVITLNIANLHHQLSMQASRSTGNFSGSLTVSSSIDNFSSIASTADLSMPGAGTMGMAIYGAGDDGSAGTLGNQSAASISRFLLGYPYVKFSIPAQGSGVTTSMVVSVK